MKHTFCLGLVGWPLSHSLSPRLHQAALQTCELSGEYVLYPIPPLPAGQADLTSLLHRLSSGELDGLNITIPHKQAVLPMLDVRSSTVQAVGAANMLYRSGKSLVGENTDVQGFGDDLDDQMAAVSPGSALVLGAGGAARAVVYALACRGWQVHLVARRPEQAQQLAVQFAALAPAPLALPQPLAEAASAITAVRARLIVNATALGMPPYNEASPWPENTALPAGCFVYDLVYNPPETQLLRQARQQSLPACNGLGMLINQAALAFLHWTDLPAERLPAIRQAMRSSI